MRAPALGFDETFLARGCAGGLAEVGGLVGGSGGGKGVCCGGVGAGRGGGGGD